MSNRVIITIILIDDMIYLHVYYNDEITSYYVDRNMTLLEVSNVLIY